MPFDERKRQELGKIVPRFRGYSRAVQNARIKDGTGDFLAPGSMARAASCTAPNPATSLVEVLVHIEIDPDDFIGHVRYLEIDAPDDTSAETVSLEAGNGTATRTGIKVYSTHAVGTHALCTDPIGVSPQLFAFTGTGPSAGMVAASPAVSHPGIIARSLWLTALMHQQAALMLLSRPHIIPM